MGIGKWQCQDENNGVQIREGTKYSSVTIEEELSRDSRQVRWTCVWESMMVSKTAHVQLYSFGWCL